MHRFSSRSGENAGLTRRVTRKRVPPGPRKRTLEYVEETEGYPRLRVAERWRCSTPDGFVAAVENL